MTVLMQKAEPAPRHAHSITLPAYPLPDLNGLDQVSIARDWAARATEVLNGDHDALDEILAPDGWLRDSLAFTWDLRTLHGVHAIRSFLGKKTGLLQLGLSDGGHDMIKFDRISDTLGWVTAVVDLRTGVGSGKAVVRLVNVDGTGQVWKAYCIFTALQEITGSEEPVSMRRPLGGNLGHINEGLQPTWFELREKQRTFADSEPDVLIIGAGK